MRKIYTGIGSRKTPINVQRAMTDIARHFSRHKWILRSGGADGADLAFEKGADLKQIFLPWKGFNGNDSPFYEHNEEAARIAAKYHPRWGRLNNSARAMHTRNVYQVLGYDLKTPTSLVICWTADGKASGGTGQALRIAKDANIPIYNLYNEEDIIRLKILMDDMDRELMEK